MVVNVGPVFMRSGNDSVRNVNFVAVFASLFIILCSSLIRRFLAFARAVSIFFFLLYYLGPKYIEKLRLLAFFWATDLRVRTGQHSLRLSICVNCVSRCWLLLVLFFSFFFNIFIDFKLIK